MTVARPPRTTLILAPGAFVALAIVAIADGERVALLTAAAAGAVLATRLRAAPWAVAIMIAGVAAFTLAGYGPGTSERPPKDGGEAQPAKNAKPGARSRK